MPLNLSNREQNSGHLFYHRRLRAAITRFSVRMKHDDRKQHAALAMSMVLLLLGCGWMALLQFVRPAGLAGRSPIVGNRDTGALYARIAGRLHPAPNLTSARLVTGSASAPTWVRGSEIEKYPTGPMVGIPGIPDAIAVARNPLSAWAVCDTAPTGGGEVTVTAVAGEPSAGGRTGPLPASHAILGVHDGSTYLVWNGHRTRVDLADRAVTFTLGLDVSRTRPVPISNALFDAMPATEPFVVPLIPAAGAPSRWLPRATVGRVLVTEDAAGATNGFYVLLEGGLQKVTPFVADLLRTAARPGSPSLQQVSPSTVVGIPEVDVLNVGFYPSGRLTFVNTAAEPVTCITWTKQSTDPQAAITILSGHGLPTPPALDGSIVRLVRDSRGPGSVEAQQVLILPGAATFVASTSAAPASETREALYWVSPQGVRYGIEPDQATWQALGIDPRTAVQAPWPILRTFAPGPAISRAGALVARDTVDPAGTLASVPGATDAHERG